MTYEFFTNDGTSLGVVQPLENNGPDNLSVPRQILDIVYNDTSFDPPCDSIVVSGELVLNVGQKVSIAGSAYDSTYTVDDGVAAAGTPVTMEALGVTRIPISGGIALPVFDIEGVQTGLNGKIYLLNVANGHYSFLPGQEFSINDNTFFPANGTYTVESAESSQIYTVESVGTNLIVVEGDITNFLSLGLTVKLSGTNGGIGDGTYQVASSALVTGNTQVTIVESLPVGTVVNSLTRLAPSEPITIVTVDGTLPVGTNNDGNLAIVSANSLTFAASTFISSTATPKVFNIIYRIAGDFTEMLIPGTPVLIKAVSIDDEVKSIVAIVSEVYFSAPTLAYPSGLTEVVTSYTNSVDATPVFITSGTSRMVFPIPQLPYGYVVYSTLGSISPLMITAKGAAQYGEDVSWGQALHQTMLNVANNFYGSNPPPALMTGQLWFDAQAPALRVKTNTTFAISDVIVGSGGSQTWVIDSATSGVVSVGETVAVFDNNVYSSGELFTVASVTETVGGLGFLIELVVDEAIGAGADVVCGVPDFPYGKLYAVSSMAGLMAPGLPATGDIDMNGYRITNVGDATANGDAVSRSYGDTRYVNVTGDAMTGDLTMTASDITLTNGVVTLQNTSDIVFDAAGSGGISVDGSGSIEVASGSITAVDGSVVVGSGTVQVAIVSNGSAAPQMVFNTAGATTTTDNEVIDLGMNRIGNSTSPVDPLDLANKQYVDDHVNGILWISPVMDPNLFADNLSAPPVVTPDVTYHRTYIVNGVGTGAWAGFNGHAMYYNGSAWVSVLGRAVIVGDRFGVFIEPDNDDLLLVPPSGGLTGHAGKIATIATVSPYTYTFYIPAEPDAVSVRGDVTGSSPHFGHSYTFRGTFGSGSYGTGYRWIEFAGPQMLVDGAGLMYTANILNVGAGSGITVNADSVALDTAYVDTLYLRLSGGTMSGAINMGGFVATNSGNATNPADVLNMQTADARYINTAGDTLTGNLILNADPSAALGAVTKQYADNINTTLTNSKVAKAGDVMTGLLVLSADPAAPLGAATKQYVDTADGLLVAKGGSTMTGLLVLSADPAAPLGAATKQYVDNNFVSKVASTVMSSAVNITFAGNGEVLGLPATPSVGGAATSKTYVDAQLALKATDSLAVHLAGTETITGAKTFNNTVTVVADGAATNLLISPTNYTVTGKITASGSAYAIAMTAGQNNGGIGGAIALTGGAGTTVGGAVTLVGGAATTLGGNVAITAGSAATHGNIVLTAGSASLTLTASGVWGVSGLIPTGTRQAIVSDPSAPTTASPKWTNIATRVAAAPVSSASPGAPGDYFSDDSFIYFYGATGWRRVAVSSF